ncbi:hypothetical protein [Levilactobacillus brevis]|uniref:hypothetical protein n=1 Tax=Levilactobacillus brevis TaxID=1580 RepID=UPI000B3EADAA|nr:hypothetical protein [Levilactobacillus brevis]ARW21826.1 hypothetical protein S101174_00983 [Levilactobacillus brevis]
MSTNEDFDRTRYLKEFKRANDPDRMGFSEHSAEVGMKLVESIKKEDLSYDEAYASLQYAYNLIKYESNFINFR